MQFAAQVCLFAVTKFMPATLRVTAAMITWLFTFVETHHAAILAFASWLVSTVFDLDVHAVTFFRGCAAYFATAAAAGLSGLLKDGTPHLFVDLEDVLSEEAAKIVVAWRSKFPVTPDAPKPTNTAN